MSILVVSKTSNNASEEIPAYKVAHMEVFRRHGNTNEYYMRVRPTQYLLNSKIIGDKLNEGVPMVLNINFGTVHFLDRNELVNIVNKAELKITL